MGRSNSIAGDSGAFSDCDSNRSGVLPLASLGSGDAATKDLQRCLVSCAAEGYLDDVLRSLITDLESPLVDVQCRAAMELRILAKDKMENRILIARAGAVPPLVALLFHADLQLQEHCVTAVLNLSLCDENKPIIAAAGGIKPLVRALGVGTQATRENAACALFRLGQVDEYRLAIGHAGAIPLLVALLEGSGHRGKNDAATALYTLLGERENKQRAVEAGVVRPLLDLMAELDGRMADKAAYVLHRVVMTVEGRAAAVEEGVIPVLVEMLETGNHRQKEIAVLSLLEICEESAVYRKIAVCEDAILPLIELSQSLTRKSSREKAEALIKLLRHPRTAGGSSGDGVENRRDESWHVHNFVEAS